MGITKQTMSLYYQFGFILLIVVHFTTGQKGNLKKQMIKLKDIEENLENTYNSLRTIQDNDCPSHLGNVNVPCQKKSDQCYCMSSTEVKVNWFTAKAYCEYYGMNLLTKIDDVNHNVNCRDFQRTRYWISSREPILPFSSTGRKNRTCFEIQTSQYRPERQGYPCQWEIERESCWTKLSFLCNKEIREGTSQYSKEFCYFSGTPIHRKDLQNESPNQHGLLRRAAKRNSGGTANCLLKLGANLQSRDEWGNTLLHTAAYNNSDQVVALLINKKVDIEAKNNDNQTALHMSAVTNSPNAAQVLIANRANLQARDQWGNSPLHTAAFHNADQVTALLINNKADIEARNIDNETPLHMATKANSALTTRVLIAHGANPKAVDNKGRFASCKCLKD